MPAKFERLGIAFQYPDDWRLDEEEAVAGNRSVTVYNPRGGGFWSVSLHPQKADSMALADAAVNAMREVYDSLEAAPAEEEIAGQTLVGYDLNFYCLDLTSTAAVRIVRTPKRTLVIFYQAEDREFEEIKAVFQAISWTLLQSAR